MNPMQLIGMLKQSQNPMAMLSNMANSNPLMGRAMQMGKGKSDDELKVIAQNLARQRGMNEKQFSDFLSSFGLNL